MVWEPAATIRHAGSLTGIVEKGVRVLRLARWQMCVSLNQLLAMPGEELPLTCYRVTLLNGDSSALQGTKKNEME